MSLPVKAATLDIPSPRKLPGFLGSALFGNRNPKEEPLSLASISLPFISPNLSPAA